MTSVSSEQRAQNPDGKPLRRDAELNRQRILQAATELFAERGITVTLDDIAVRAGVGVGTVYRRFADRDALVDTLFEEAIDALVATAEEALEIQDPWDGLVYFVHGHLHMQQSNRAFASVVLSDSYGRDKVLVAKERIKPTVTALVERARAAGVVRPDLDTTDIPMITMMLASVVDATRDISPDLWERYFAIALDGIRPGSTTPLTVPALTPDQVPEAMRCGFSKR